MNSDNPMRFRIDAGLFPALLIVLSLTLMLSGCASKRLQNYYEIEPMEDRRPTEMDFKNPEDLNRIGKQPGAQ